MNYPLVSAIILNFNGKSKLPDILTLCISSVLNSDYPNLEVIFFDNGSTDDSVKFVDQKFHLNAKLRIIGITDNCGPAGGFNEALKHVRGKYIVILNNDVEIEPGSIRELVKTMEADSTIGIAQSKIMCFDRLHIQSVGLVLDLSLTAYNIGYAEEDTDQYNSFSEATSGHGACLILRRSMIERIGLFDQNYFLLHDDVDLGLRARLSGFKTMYVPSSIVYHKEGATISSFMQNEVWYYQLVSRVGLFIKNFEFRNILKIGLPVFIRTILDMYSLLRHGNASLALKFTFGVFSNFKKDWSSRKIQKKMRRISDDEVFKYFLDYPTFLFHLKRSFFLNWAFRPHENLGSSLNRVCDDYYRDHKIDT